MRSALITQGSTEIFEGRTDSQVLSSPDGDWEKSPMVSLAKSDDATSNTVL